MPDDIPITWRLDGEGRDPDFGRGYDGEMPIGVVIGIKVGIDAGQWGWSMTVIGTGRNSERCKGQEPTKDAAKGALAGSYHELTAAAAGNRERALEHHAEVEARNTRAVKGGGLNPR